MSDLVLYDNTGIATFHFTSLVDARSQSFDVAYSDDDGNTPSVNAIALGDAFIAEFDVGTWSSQAVFEKVTTVQQESGVLLTGQSIRGDQGTDSATHVSPAVTPRVTKYTGVAGKAHRGRIYMPSYFLQEAQVTPEGVLEPSLVSDWQDKWDAIVPAWAAAGVPAILLHTSGAVTPNVVQRMVVRSTVGTQRRRQKIA